MLWREPGPHVLKFKEKWGVGIWAGRDNLADMHIILTRQGALTARSIRRLAPSEAADQQLLLAVKGHPGRLKAMTDDPEMLPYHQHKVRCQADYQNPQQRRIQQQNQHRQRQQEERKRTSSVRKNSQRRR